MNLNQTTTMKKISAYNRARQFGLPIYAIMECLVTVVISANSLKSNLSFFIVCLIARTGLPILLYIGYFFLKSFFFSTPHQMAISYIFWVISLGGLCVLSCELAVSFPEKLEIFSVYDSFIHNLAFLFTSVQYTKHRTATLVSGVLFCSIYHSIRSIGAESLLQDLLGKFLSLMIIAGALSVWFIGNRNSIRNIKEKAMKPTVYKQKAKKEFKASLKIEDLPEPCFLIDTLNRKITEKNSHALSFFREHELNELSILESLKIVQNEGTKFESIMKKNAQQKSISFQGELFRADEVESQSQNLKSLMSFITEKLVIMETLSLKKCEIPAILTPSGNLEIQEQVIHKCLCTHWSEMEEDVSPRSSLMTKNDPKTVFNVRFFEKQKGYAVCFLKEDESNLRDRIIQNASRVMRQVCHDIRNPASSIELFCKMAKSETTVSYEFKKKYLSTIKTSAMTIQILAEDLLDVFLMEHGSFKLRSEKMLFAKVLTQAKKIIEVQLGQKKVAVTFELAKEVPPFIYTDKDRFFQIILNLLSNARKFTQEGEIKMKVEKEPNTTHVFRVSVSDTGTGMSPEFLKVIGNEGVREENAASSALNPKGIGLGLNLCQKLACLIGPNDPNLAKLIVSSTPGVGSTFSFTVESQAPVTPTRTHQKFTRAKTCASNFSERNKLNKLKEQKTHQEGPDKASFNLIKMRKGIEEREETKEKKETSNDFRGSSFKKEKTNEAAMSFSRKSEEQVSPLNGEIHASIEEASIRNRSSSNSESSPTIKTIIKVPYVFKKQQDFNKLKTIKAGRKQSISFLLKEPNSKKKVSVLVADDEQINIFILEKQLLKLRPDSFAFIRAENGGQALRIFKSCIDDDFESNWMETFIQIVFLDNQMPVMSGVDVANSILELCESKGIDPPVMVLITADKDLQNVEMFDYFLPKPVKKEGLENLLEDLQLS